MTEAQAKQLAQNLLGRQSSDHQDDGYCRINYEATITEIKEALMSAYNDGWENGFEEHGSITPMGSTKWR